MRSITILLFASIFIISGCGDDTVTNNSNGSGNTGIVLFQADSLSYWSDFWGVVIHKDSVIFQTSDTTIKNINISFTLQANMSGGSSLFGDSIYNTGTNFHSFNGEVTGIVDTSYSFNISINNSNTLLTKFYINFVYNPTHEMRYIKLKDIKVKRIN